MTKKKKKKKKLKISGLLFLLLVLYLIIMSIYYIFKLPVKSIIIKNNSLVSESEIIKVLNIDDSTPLFKINSLKVKKKLKNLDLINDVKVSKSINGKLTINITENKILFFNMLDNKFVLSDASSMEYNPNYIGYPTLVNYVPSEIYEDFIKKLSKISLDVIHMISEIEYSPDTYNGTTLDDERFLLRMNDGNTIYTNIANMEKLDNYQTIIASVEDKGILYLDSSSKNYIFTKYGEKTKEEEADDEL